MYTTVIIFTNSNVQIALYKFDLLLHSLDLSYSSSLKLFSLWEQKGLKMLVIIFYNTYSHNYLNTYCTYCLLKMLVIYTTIPLDLQNELTCTISQIPTSRKLLTDCLNWSWSFPFLYDLDLLVFIVLEVSVWSELKMPWIVL